MPTTVTSKGQVTIPKAVRDYLGLEPGSRVAFRRTADGRVEIVPDAGAEAADPPAPARPLQRLRGHAGRGPSTEDIMALTRGKRRGEWREEP